MKPFICALYAAGLLATLAGAETVEKPWFKRSSTADKALEVLRATGSVAKEPRREQRPARDAVLRSALHEASQLAPSNVLLKDIVATALANADRAANVEDATTELESGVRQAIELLSFVPVMEADLPKGFPAPTPVGEIAVKELPAYRAARTSMNGETWAFWRLFAHITANGIAMTAPVEVTYSRPSREADERIKRESMAFLYGAPNLGKPATKSDVAVVDLPPARYLSMGLRGDWNSQAVAAAQQHLDRWMEAHADEYKVAGNLRMMGYNSPKVPVSKRYFEVELPIEPLDRGAANETSVKSQTAEK